MEQITHCAADDTSWQNNWDVQPKPPKIWERVNGIIKEAVIQLKDAVDAGLIEVPDGTFSSIAALQVQLDKLATFTSPKVYSKEAIISVEALGELSEALEPFRLAVLAELNKELEAE